MLIRNEQRFSPGKQPRLLVRSMVLYYLIAFSCILQPFLVQPVNAKLDFMTKLKLIGLIALGSKKVSIVPFPLPIPIPIHFEGKEEVIYVNAPSPYSSAYSYPKGPMHDYSGPSDYGHSMAASSGSYGVHPQHSSHKSKGYKSGPNSDYAAHASESMPVTTSFRYGDRLSAKPNGNPRPVPNRPNPNTVNHNRGYRNNRNYNYRPANNEISAPVIATSTTPASPPQYDYSSPYTTQIEQSQSQGQQQQQQSQQQDQSSNDQQQQSLRIALIPIKSLNLDNLGDQSTSQQHTQQQQQQQVNLYAPPGQNQQDNQLPENLVNYIRQVQNSLGQSGQEERPASEDQSGEQNQPSSQLEQNYSQVEYADPSSNSGQQQQQQQQQQQYSSSTTTTQSSSSNQPEEPVTEQVVTQKPTQSNSFNSIPSQHFQTIQSNQFPEIPSTPQFSSFSSVQFPEIPNKSQHQSSQSSQSPQFPSIESSWQLNNYNPSSYVPHYKAPELKVIRTRYNPKQQQQEQFQFQNQKPDSFVTYSSSNNNAQPNSPQVHNSQFLYTVSHQSNPSVPYSFGQSHQIPSSYPTIDNFGLAQFQASQSKQHGHSKRSNLINPLMAASSFEVPTWITSPTSLFPKPARNPFRLRTRKHS